MRKLLLAILLLPWMYAQGATLNPADLQYATVAAAISASSPGDTIQLTNGTVTWTSVQTIGVGKAIYIKGMGTNNTRIIGGGKPTIYLAASGAEFSDFTIQKPILAGTDDYAFQIDGKHCDLSGNYITSYRIHNMLLIGGKRNMLIYGHCNGVVDHCRFWACDIAGGMNGDDDRAWARSYLPGTSDYPFFEDNEFYITSNLLNEQNYHNSEGAVGVYRYNYYKYFSDMSGGGPIEAHGNNSYQGTNAICSQQRGTVLGEIYNNIVDCSTGGYRVFYLRGGSWLIHDNVIHNSGVFISVIVFTEEEAWLSSNFPTLRTVWPAQDQITNTFCWNNTLDSTPVNSFFVTPSQAATFVQGGRDVFMEAPNALNGRPAGVYASYAPYTYPHPLVSGGGSGSLSLSSATYSTSETNASITVTVNRVGTTGTVGFSYTTADGTATAGNNYTATTGSKSMTNGQSSTTIAIPILNTLTCGNPTFNFIISSPTGGATLGTPTSAVITITGSGSSSPATMVGLGPWLAASGGICSPFRTNGNVVFQTVDTTNPGVAGKASYSFTCAAGNYNVLVELLAPDDSGNSCFIDIDNIPVANTNVWDVTINTNIFTKQYASWTRNTPPASPRTWPLSAGTHTLNLYGREANLQFTNITVINLQAGTVSSISTTATNGAYKAGVVLPITVNFTTNAIVTGTPTLSLNNGITLNYTSGSGTSALTFNYTIGTGHDSQTLDISGPTALSGTIKDANGSAFNLTTPTPGFTGSLSATKTIIVDTIAPIVTIGTPVPSISPYTPITIPIVYADNNIIDTSITLNTNGVVFTLLQGNLTVSKAVTTSINPRIVTITPLTGTGTFNISINSGTCTDLAGNVASGAGPSSTVTVYTTTTLNATRVNAGQVSPR